LNQVLLIMITWGIDFINLNHDLPAGSEDLDHAVRRFQPH